MEENPAIERVRAFCQLLEFLRKDYSDWLKTPARSKATDLNRAITDETRFRVVEHSRLRRMTEAAVRGGDLELGGEGLLFLRPPIKKVMLPVLGIKSNLRNGSLGVEMALFTFDESADGSRAKLAAIGFRFETPEEKGDKHVYHHAQMIRRFEKSCEHDLPMLPPWFPDSLPAFPLSAKTPFSLFLAVLISIYGLKHLEREWNGQRFRDPLMKEVIEIKEGCGYC